MIANKGVLPVNEHADPQVITKTYKMSKAAFKRAIGGLLKTKRISKTSKGFVVNKETEFSSQQSEVRIRS